MTRLPIGLCLCALVVAPGCLFLDTPTQTPPAPDMASPTEDMTRPPEPTEDMGVVDASPPVIDLGGPDAEPPECFPRELSSCTLLERLQEAEVDDGCGARLKCGDAEARLQSSVFVAGARDDEQLVWDLDPPFEPAPDHEIVNWACPDSEPVWQEAVDRYPHLRLSESPTGETLVRGINPAYGGEAVVLDLVCAGEENAGVEVEVRLPAPPTMWLRADAYLPSGDGPPARWGDEGAARLSFQTFRSKVPGTPVPELRTDANYPYFRLNQFEGFGAGFFHGFNATPSANGDGGVSLGTQFSVMFVVRYEGSEDEAGVLHTDPATGTVVRFDESPNGVALEVQLSGSRTVFRGELNGGAEGVHVYTITRDNTALRIYKNAQRLVRSTALLNVRGFSLREIGKTDEDSGKTSFRGDFAEILAFDKALTMNERLETLAYLRAKHQGELP